MGGIIIWIAVFGTLSFRGPEAAAGGAPDGLAAFSHRLQGQATAREAAVRPQDRSDTTADSAAPDTARTDGMSPTAEPIEMKMSGQSNSEEVNASHGAQNALSCFT